MSRVARPRSSPDPMPSRWREPGRERRALRPGRSRASLCARRGRLPRCRPALRPARGPDRSGAVLLPSPRPAKPLARIDRHFRSTTGTGVPARRPALRRNQKKGRKNVGRTQHHPKTAIVIPIARVIPVTVGAAGVVSMIVPRAAPHDLSRLPDRVSPPGRRRIAKKSRAALRAAGEVSPAPPPESDIPE